MPIIDGLGKPKGPIASFTLIRYRLSRPDRWLTGILSAPAPVLAIRSVEFEDLDALARQVSHLVHNYYKI